MAGEFTAATVVEQLGADERSASATAISTISTCSSHSGTTSSQRSNGSNSGYKSTRSITRPRRHPSPFGHWNRKTELLTPIVFKEEGDRTWSTAPTGMGRRLDPHVLASPVFTLIRPTRQIEPRIYTVLIGSSALLVKLSNRTRLSH